MKNLRARQPAAGFSLMLVLVTIGICFLILTGVLLWSSNSGQFALRQTERCATLAAAEAATEKVVAQMTEDFRQGGRAQVEGNLVAYPGLVPSGVEHAAWNNYEFLDSTGTAGQSYVGIATNWHAGPVNWKGGNLVGQSTTYRIVATARSRTTPIPTTAAVRQDLEMAIIPLVSFFMFAQPDLELSPTGGDWYVNGPVHGNANLYFSPSTNMTFADQVTAAGLILQQRAPGDLSGGGGTLTYLGTPQAGAGVLRPSLTGMPTNPANLWNFCANAADLRITIFSDTYWEGVNKAGGPLPACTNEVWKFLTPAPNAGDGILADWRECDVTGAGGPEQRIIVSRFSVSDFQSPASSLKHYMVNGQPPRSVYLEDRRIPTPSIPFYGVKVINGGLLNAPLTITTRQPLYVQGPFNAPFAGSTNGAKAAGFIADAVTVLSEAWLDSKSHVSLSGTGRDVNSTGTTINAAVVAGNVRTETSYSGGIENLTRLLEDWSPGGSPVNLYFNGSLVLLFHSQFAVGEWEQGNVYETPYRIFRFAPQIGATAPIVSDLQAGLVVRALWRTTLPGATE